MDCDNILIGEYIIIQRQNYRKIHKFNNATSCISLGKDNIELTAIEGCKYNSIFKMIPKSTKKNKLFSLQLTSEAKGLKDELDIKVSGTDNRNICDDGRSQNLSAADIEQLLDTRSASDIVDILITNSNTFHNKTEFSQEKYLKKKEKKYFEYIQIRRPNLRLIAEIMYRLEPIKIQGIRIDTLSQMITLANIKAEGNHLLYDSGSNGLMEAALLSVIGKNTDAKLLHMHPGNMSQKQGLLAMNFPKEQYERCISVNIYSALRQFYQGCDRHIDDNSVSNETESLLIDKSARSADNKRKAEDDIKHNNKIPKLSDKDKIDTNSDINNDCEVTEKLNELKKPKWHFDNIAAADILLTKMDSLVIACKEDPANIFNELVSFIKPGRPFVIFHSVAEPLQHLYMTLKSQNNVAALRLTCNWMRNYQVLPERTHPEVMMNNSGGFLLSGYVLKC